MVDFDGPISKPLILCVDGQDLVRPKTHTTTAKPRRMEGFMFIDPASCFHAAAQRAKGLRTDRLHKRREGPMVASLEPWEVAHQIALRVPVIRCAPTTRRDRRP